MTKTQLSPTHIARYAILLGLALLLVWLGIKSWRIAQVANNLQAHQTAAESLLADGLTQIDPIAAEELVLGLRRDVVVLQRETAVFMPITPYLGWLPRVGPLVAAAPQLMVMADEGTRTAVFAYRSLAPALDLINNENEAISPLPSLVNQLALAQPDLIQAELALNSVVAARHDLPYEENLPWRVRTLLAQADEWLPLAQRGFKIIQVLPDIMGHEQPRRYLLLAQNEDELRPTGGYLSGAGVLLIDRGQILDIAFQDANQVDAWAETGWSLTKPYGFAPQPYFDFMGMQPFLFRDSNFWPNFPTSAQQAIELYQYGQDDLTPFDGVIAIDQHFLQLLVQATGPLYLEDGQIITSRNLSQAMRDAWNERGEEATAGEWIQQRKDFLGIFSQALRQKLETDVGSVDLLLLVQNMDQGAQGKHIQLYLQGQGMDQAARVVDQLGWNGRIHLSPQQDILMIVEANFGYNKVNSLITRSTTYHVDLAQREATASVTYSHHGTAVTEPCDQTVNYSVEIRYEDMVNRCYWNFVRFYAPADSQLLEASRHPAPATAFVNEQAWSGEAYVMDDPTGLTAIANFLLLDQGETAVVYKQYQLPASIIQPTEDGYSYQLAVYKQGGLPPEPLTITVTLPPGAHLLAAEPAPTAINGQQVKFDTRLGSDLQFSLSYTVP